jgi:RHS repeat-associated protein
MYVHGHGIDAPLAVLREAYSDSIPGGWFYPTANWRGAYDGGYGPRERGECYTREYTWRVMEDLEWDGQDEEIENHHSGGTETVCADVDWPAQHTWAFRQYRRGYNGPMNWMGSLIYESRDASGLHYRRNRFYDAEAGRFTQEDPIGMAGGINVYGFGNGDPVGYGDPYGLSATGCKGLLSCIQSIFGGGHHRSGTASVGEPTVVQVMDNPAYFSGVTVNAIVGGGGTGAAGVYSTANTQGFYLRLGVAAGLDAGISSEFGKASSEEALVGRADAVCVGALATSFCAGGSSSGSFASGGIGVGSQDLPTPVGSHHIERSFTVLLPIPTKYCKPEMPDVCIGQ